MNAIGYESVIFGLGSDEFVALSVDIDELDRRIVLKMLAQLGDVDVHRTSVKVVVIDPDSLQSVVALENLVDVCAKEAQQFRLLGCQLGDLVANHENLLLGIESEVADFVHRDFLALLTLDAA